MTLVINIGQRYQHTIARPAQLEGIGYITGADIRLRFNPAPPDTGLVFTRVDLDPARDILARVENVVGTPRRTILGKNGVEVGMVEHVLAALAGLRIDNCHIEINGAETPGQDGSSRDFTSLLLRAGIRLQPALRSILTTEEPISVTQRGATLTLHPSTTPGLKISYLTDFDPLTPVGRQRKTIEVNPASFAAELASTRTFIFEQEVAELKKQGIGTRTTTRDLVVFGKDGPIDNTLRYADEPARHKILDIVGDLALFGGDLYGHVVAFRSGHALNVELVRELTRRLEHKQPLRRAA